MADTDGEYGGLIERFAVDQNLLVDSRLWMAVLRPRQVTLGALVLLPKRFVPDYSDLSADEAADLFPLVTACQRVVRNVFQADKFNLIAAMMKDPFLHFHLIPRYESSRDFAGVTWTDQDWPGLVSFSRSPASVDANDAVLDALKAAGPSLKS